MSTPRSYKEHHSPAYYRELAARRSASHRPRSSNRSSSSTVSSPSSRHAPTQPRPISSQNSHRSNSRSSRNTSSRHPTHNRSTSSSRPIRIASHHAALSPPSSPSSPSSNSSDDEMISRSSRRDGYIPSAPIPIPKRERQQLPKDFDGFRGNFGGIGLDPNPRSYSDRQYALSVERERMSKPRSFAGLKKDRKFKDFKVTMPSTPGFVPPHILAIEETPLEIARSLEPKRKPPDWL